MADIQNNYNCALELTMDLIGGKWKLIILWHLLDGSKRFNQLDKLIPAITQKMLTTQLRELEEKGLVNRKVYPQVPPKVEYSLSERGRSLEKILNALCSWSKDYANENNISVSCNK
ncbi:winged helix-turn-helix transcriptional regulator [Clostridium sp. LQ25]|uniref:winged helix-turn-helix transcriptional regulator n=1 Tax=Clostridium TaxID=1485 RepID=UPI00051C0606|nr:MULTISPECIES: winged helix-turn-helix transcriptional regulator [Clostridium]MCQ2015280.1 winged helix-turn-helix transcriptional regulator [Clostridium butyricum]MCQ2026742.1 winged helix-turn-helix transcriptional regulator [Clostridium butyricum]MDU4751784.1 winged helix-turn-helix transcriptional regulator [Clostridium butyricum]QUF85260.1 winged helix-turn-helix transcriptional regulator [Clostridium butyricum]UZT08659.1 winged helix-turn-helix transcriptional regulator [Clostridium sp